MNHKNNNIDPFMRRYDMFYPIITQYPIILHPTYGSKRVY